MKKFSIQPTTPDKDVMVFGQMAIILFPVLFKSRQVLKRTKTTKIKCKDNETSSWDVATLSKLYPVFWCGSLLYDEN